MFYWLTCNCVAVYSFSGPGIVAFEGKGCMVHKQGEQAGMFEERSPMLGWEIEGVLRFGSKPRAERELIRFQITLPKGSP